MGAQPSSAQTTATLAPGATVDVIDRLARQLGVADVSDRLARVLGVADVSDRAARLLGRAGPLADTTTSGSYTAPAQVLTIVVPSGSAQMSAFAVSGNAVLVAEYSSDGATTFIPLVGARTDQAGAPSSTVLNGAGPAGFQAALPPGATHVRVRSTAVTTTVPTFVAVGQQTVESAVAVSGGSLDVNDRAARLLGQVSPAAGALWDVGDRPGRLLGVEQGGIADTLHNVGYVASPGALATIAQITNIPAGVYRAIINASTIFAPAGSDTNNMELMNGGASVGRLLVGANQVAVPTLLHRITIAANATVLVRAVLAGTHDYEASIDLTRLS